MRAAMNDESVDSSFRERLTAIGMQLSEVVSTLEQRLQWLRSKKSEDPLLLEEYKSHALEVEARIKQLSPMIKELDVSVKSFWERV